LPAARRSSRWSGKPSPRSRTSLRVFVDADNPIEIDIGAQASNVIALLPVPATQRGWLQVPRITIETTWPLGLVRAWSYVVPDLAIAWSIRRRPPRHRHLPWSSDTATRSSRDGRGADDFSGMRDHQAADSPRHVAWKTVARQHDGPLLTKLFSGATAQQVWLDWDTLARGHERTEAAPFHPCALDAGRRGRRPRLGPAHSRHCAWRRTMAPDT
jgi:uncharacterized protein (DUF58 family)